MPIFDQIKDKLFLLISCLFDTSSKLCTNPPSSPMCPLPPFIWGTGPTHAKNCTGDPGLK